MTSTTVNTITTIVNNVGSRVSVFTIVYVLISSCTPPESLFIPTRHPFTVNVARFLCD